MMIEMESGKTIHTGGIDLSEEMVRSELESPAAEARFGLMLDRIRDAAKERPDHRITLTLIVHPGSPTEDD